MIDINLIRKNPDQVKKAIASRQRKLDLDILLKVDKKRREILTKVQNLRAQVNKASREISKLSGLKKQRKIMEAKAEALRIKEYEQKLIPLDKKFNQYMGEVPNLPRPDVKIGKGEEDNEVIKKVGKPKKFDFKVKDHLEIGRAFDLIDVERAVKVSGSRFGYLKREVALLEIALINFAFEVIVGQGFIPVFPPVLIKEKMMQGMGYLAWHGEEECYHFEKDKLYLVGTSEQSLIPMHADEIFDEKDLPRRYVGFSSCFRREAGAAGKDTHGILRVHQFDKVEMVSFTVEEDSDKEHEYLLSLQEKLVSRLKIPYRVVKICTGDLSIPSARTYDLECWMPGQGCYRETHSSSNCTDFQARRLKIRYRKKEENGRTRLKFVHTLNATAFAMGRILIAILENYQEKDGSVRVPEVLQKYTGFKKIKK